MNLILYLAAHTPLPVATAVWTQKLTDALPVMIAEAAIKAGLPPTSLKIFVTGIATNNVTLAETAPGVTPAIVMAGGAAALDAYAFALKYIWIVGAYKNFLFEALI